MITTSNDSRSIQLIATDNCGSTRSFVLAADQGVFIGRSSNCGLQLPGEGINDIHCRIGFEDGKLQVQDWMSNTGTRVNGQAIESSADLKEGDVIQIGGQSITIGSCVSPSTARSALNASTAIEANPRDDVREDFDDADDSMDASESFDDPIDAFERIDDTTFDGGLLDPESIDFDADFSSWDEEETFDRETVELLRAEIDDLRAALSQRDADPFTSIEHEAFQAESAVDTSVDLRMQELIEEANRSDERVSLLEEMLHAAEDTRRNELEERHQLEAWVSDIETRIGHREEEHAAEIDALRQRLEESQQEQESLRRKLSQAARGGNAPQQYEETLEKLQQANRDLQERLAQTQKERLALQKQLEESSSMHDRAIREERANIAKEQARLARLRFELSQKVSEVEAIPKGEHAEDKEAAGRIRALRQHLREIHEQEKKEEAEASLTTRLARLWKRVEY
jgi:pSer/pThr/pTyr-binding forkhead associated (FHA) protein